MRRAVSWTLSVVVAAALMISVVAAFATREVFDADRFAARTEAALQTDAVSDEVARRLTDAVIAARPDLVAVRPLVLGAAEGVVRSAAFGAVVRGSVRDLHRSAFNADAGTVTLTVVDAGLLVSEALDRLRPDLAARIPDTVRVTLTDTADGPPLEVVQAAQDVKWLTWIALAVALLAGAAAVFVGARGSAGAVGASGRAAGAGELRGGTAAAGEPRGGAAAGGQSRGGAAVGESRGGAAADESRGGEAVSGESRGSAAAGGRSRGGAAVAAESRGGAAAADESRDGVRGAALRVGAAVALIAGITGLVANLAPRVLTGDAAARAVLEEWLDPLALRCWVVCAGAAIVTTAAASLWQPPAPGTLWAQARRIADRVPPTGRALVAIALGAVALAAPLVLLRVVVMAAGAFAVLWGTGVLLRRVAPPTAVALPPRDASLPAEPLSDTPAAGRRRVSPRRAAVGAGALLVAAGALVFSLSASAAKPVRVGKCNGSAALCDRTLDQVAFVGTHNSMSADGEPGWLFAAQNAGIAQQLDDGVRALLIDTHYGFQTARGVATDLERDSKSREKVTSELGEDFIATALRLRTRIGYDGGGTAEVFLCHAFCEVGATKAVEALKDVHEFLVQHPEEVLILSIEDDTDPKDTAKIIRDSGLIREVYQGPAKPPWPTLQQMIERNERVLVLIENEPGDEPWMHRQDTVAQETPYRFTTAAALEAEDSCAPNRGGDRGSLLLVNHWVDTSPAPRKTIARAVNSRAVLGARLDKCQRERNLLPNIVAVDFYRDGDTFALVEERN